MKKGVVFAPPNRVHDTYQRTRDSTRVQVHYVPEYILYILEYIVYLPMYIVHFKFLVSEF